MSASTLRIADHHRPRLEPAHDGTGPVPDFHPRGVPHPEPVEGLPEPIASPPPSLMMMSSSNHDRDALRGRIDAALDTALHAWRDLRDVLATADRVLTAADAHAAAWFAHHG